MQPGQGVKLKKGRETKKLVMLKASLNPDAMLDVLFQRKS